MAKGFRSWKVKNFRKGNFFVALDPPTIGTFMSESESDSIWRRVRHEHHFEYVGSYEFAD